MKTYFSLILVAAALLFASTAQAQAIHVNHRTGQRNFQRAAAGRR